MQDFLEFVNKCIQYFFSSFFSDLISFFAGTLSDIMASSSDVLDLPIVGNATTYFQSLAFTILVLKSTFEAYQTYILYQNGDSDADPASLLVRTTQAVAVIASLPFIVEEVFKFGTKVTADLSGLSVGSTGIDDFIAMLKIVVASSGTVVLLFFIIVIVLMLVISVQAAIRGAELALMMIIGPIMALNLTSNNTGMWSSWFKQLLIVCTAQGLQIIMLMGAFSKVTNTSVSGGGLIVAIGWLWVTIKTPKFIQQFAYSTGFSGAIGGTAKQAGSMMIMKKMMK